MEKASPFLEHIAVSQFLAVNLVHNLIFLAKLDIFLFKGAKGNK